MKILYYKIIRKVRRFFSNFGIIDRQYEGVFQSIHNSNYWGNPESRSGGGSTLESTESIRIELPTLFSRLGIHSILDLPCGDYNWVSSMKIAGIRYTGGDIVPELIKTNRRNFPEVDFRIIDLINDRLPKVDLILCRDCFVHLPLPDIKKALQNIQESRSRWFLTTSFTRHSLNQDIAPGKWRPLNLEIPPFNLPPPVEKIYESSTDDNGRHSDKSLSLWKISKF